MSRQRPHIDRTWRILHPKTTATWTRTLQHQAYVLHLNAKAGRFWVQVPKDSKCVPWSTWAKWTGDFFGLFCGAVGMCEKKYSFLTAVRSSKKISYKSLNDSVNHIKSQIYVYENSIHEIDEGPPLQVGNGNSHWPEANSSRARTCVSSQRRHLVERRLVT